MIKVKYFANDKCEHIISFDDILAAHKHCIRRLEKLVNSHIEEYNLDKEDVWELEYGYVENEHYDFWDEEKDIKHSWIVD